MVRDRCLKVVDEEDPETWVPANIALEIVAETLKRKKGLDPQKTTEISGKL